MIVDTMPKTTRPRKSGRAEVRLVVKCLACYISNLFSRALLPDLVNFAYIPQNEIRVHAAVNVAEREGSPDFASFQTSRDSLLGSNESAEPEHVLVLDFAENWSGKPSSEGSG